MIRSRFPGVRAETRIMKVQKEPVFRSRSELLGSASLALTHEHDHHVLAGESTWVGTISPRSCGAGRSASGPEEGSGGRTSHSSSGRSCSRSARRSFLEILRQNASNSSCREAASARHSSLAKEVDSIRILSGGASIPGNGWRTSSDTLLNYTRFVWSSENILQAGGGS